MSQITIARSFIHSAPREAVSDMLGLVGLCAMIFAGFAAPFFF